MNKRLLFVIIAIVLIVGGAIAYILFRPNKTASELYSSKTNQLEKTSADDLPLTTNEAESSKGAYIAYSEDALRVASGTKLLFFHAPWCPQCRSIEASINEDGLPNDVTVFKIDYDSNQMLRQKYGVTIQTTFVKVDSDGNKIDSYVAYDDPVFSSVQKALLR